ncbi:hypothetical protein BGZ70_004610, partial [Mortierella alpina]
MEKRKHKAQHSIHSKQHQSHPTAAAKKLHSRIKSAFFRKGKVYIAGRPDWYNEYRQQRGPHNIMRKLSLESSHRRKATLTFPLMGGGPTSSLEPAAADGDDGGDELGTESKATDDQSGVKDKPVESDDESGDGKEDDMSEDGREDEEGGRGSQSIQAVKKPQFVGVPTPVSVRHSGIIPKESSCGR